MKKCPHCDSVFGDALLYCTHDGTPLIDETSSLPPPGGEEEETIIRNNPIVIELPPQPPPLQTDYRTAAPEEVVVVRNPRGAVSYLAFLIAGLLLGGGLVLATLFLAGVFDRESGTAGEPNRIVKTPPAVEASPERTPHENQDSAAAGAAVQKHPGRTAAGDGEFNGRVIVAGANMRSAPDRDAPEIEILPLGDRLKIERRAGENSPWYRVTCEHGASGWVHGNAIEYAE